MACIAAIEFGPKLCEILGIDPKVTRSIRIDVEAGSVTVAVVQRYISPDEFREITRLLEMVAWREASDG